MRQIVGAAIPFWLSFVPARKHDRSPILELLHIATKNQASNPGCVSLLWTKGKLVVRGPAHRDLCRHLRE